MPDSARAAPALLTLIVLFGGALAGAVRRSMWTPSAGLDIEPWRQVLADPALADALRFSLTVTVVATTASALLAIPIAAALRRRPAVRAAFGLPVLVPHLVVAVAAVAWLGTGGLADRLLDGLPVQLVRDRAGLGIILVYVYKELPFLVLLLVAAWDRHTTEREEAAAALGAGWAQRLRFVVWPAVRTPLVTGSLVAAAYVLGAFEVPLVVGPTYPPTLATLAYEHTQAADLAGTARAAATLLLATGLTLALAVPAARTARSRDA